MKLKWSISKFRLFYFLGEKYDIILFDVDNKDVSLGMSCPPQEFVNENVLNDVKHCLNENGAFF